MRMNGTYECACRTGWRGLHCEQFFDSTVPSKRVSGSIFCMFPWEIILFRLAVRTSLECYNWRNRGQDYSGKVALANNGEACRNWSEALPMQPWVLTEYREAFIRMDGTSDKNYCRNPFKSWSSPSCFTINGGLQSCSNYLPLCNGL